VTVEANRVAHRVGGGHLCSVCWTVNAFLHFYVKKLGNPQKTAVFGTPDRDPNRPTEPRIGGNHLESRPRIAWIGPI